MAPLSESHTILLGGIAGVTIFFGLPLGRMRNPTLRLKTFLNAISASPRLILAIFGANALFSTIAALGMHLLVFEDMSGRRR